MKRSGLLWILMLALIVPALALSGCDKKKHHNDSDDDESSTEKSEKKPEIIGEYELDEEGIRVLFSDAMDSCDRDLNFRCVLSFGDDNEFRLNYITEASVYDSDLDNNMQFYLDVQGEGTWKYDKKDKLLTINIKTADLEDFDFSFAKDNDMTEAFINEYGGMDALKEDMRVSFMGEMEPSDLYGEQEFKITELTDDGFYARTTSGEIQKLRFVRVN